MPGGWRRGGRSRWEGAASQAAGTNKEVMFGSNASGGVVAEPPPHPGYWRSGLRPGEGGLTVA